MIHTSPCFVCGLQVPPFGQWYLLADSAVNLVCVCVCVCVCVGERERERAEQDSLHELFIPQYLTRMATVV